MQQASLKKGVFDIHEILKVDSPILISTIEINIGLSMI